MFEKILIANRGEIACRVMKTARKMGIKTVAVYSDADKDALHVQMADEAVHIGASASSESYLLMDRIIQACKETGAQAVHPGYGFLSENATFCQALEKEKIVFIGPASYAMTSMGDKITSKKLAQKAGVNTIPGYTDVVKDSRQAIDIAANIGYPIMLKASAGGGGKGMRIAWNEQQCSDGFERASNEARSSFGDDRIFIEKYIQQPRHIEIQVMADTHGNIIYLGERECSIQRRHQKVIEEAPSPFIDEVTRKAMGEQAVMLARAVDYRSAGTVEFIVDINRNFYFLEMNTRLQVEHPVTEFITGQDLVELMIRIAHGEKLPLTQAQVKLTGWAMETRVYAEDPFRNFLPSIGRLVHYRPPTGENIRVDTGVYEGGEVSMFYDPMIAKLVTYGKDRLAAIETMQQALDEYYIRGVSHNISFLNALMVHPRFIEGNLSTNFIAEEFANGFNAQMVVKDDAAIPIVVAAMIHRNYMDRAAKLTGQLAGHERRVHNDWAVIIDKEIHPVQVEQKNGVYEVYYQDQLYCIETNWSLGDPLFHANISHANISNANINHANKKKEKICFQVQRIGLWYHLFHRGARTEALVTTPNNAKLQNYMLEKEPADLSKFVLSPMPGLLIKLALKEGMEVKVGDELVIIEAMKMENVLRAENDAVIKKIKAKVGDSLMVDQVIIEFE